MNESACEQPAPIHMVFERVERCVFALLIVLHLLPLFLVKHFPTQDGPAHLYNALVISEYHLPTSEAFRSFFVFTPELVPNWFSHALLAALMYVAPPLIAEKLLVGGYIIMLAVACRFAVTGINPRGAFVSLLIFPFVFNFLTMAGFYNWVWSITAMLLAIGYWLRNRNTMNWKKAGVLFLLAAVMHFMHIVSVVMTCLFIAVVAVVETVSDTVSRSRHETWRRFVSRALWPAAAFVPSAALIGWFMLQRSESVAKHLPREQLWQELLNLGPLLSIASRLDSRLISIHNRLDLFGTWLMVFGGLLLAMGAYRVVRAIVCRQVKLLDCIALVVGAYLAMYFTVPDQMATGSYIAPRLAIYSLLAMVLFLAVGDYDRRSRIAFASIAVGVSTLLLFGVTMRMRALDAALEETTAAATHIAPGSTVLTISRAPWGDHAAGTQSGAAAVFQHVDGYINLAARSVSLVNYEANTGHFPLMYREALNPYEHMTVGGPQMLEGMAPQIDIAAYESKTGHTVDYIAVWHGGTRDLGDSDWQGVQQQIDVGYELIFESKPRGLMKLYERRQGEGEANGESSAADSSPASRS